MWLLKSVPIYVVQNSSSTGLDLEIWRHKWKCGIVETANLFMNQGPPILHVLFGVQMMGTFQQPHLLSGNAVEVCWHYVGSALHSYDKASNAGIWQVSGWPFLNGILPTKAITHPAEPSEEPRDEHRDAAADRGPALQSEPIANSKHHG